MLFITLKVECRIRDLMLFIMLKVVYRIAKETPRMRRRKCARGRSLREKISCLTR